MADKKVTVVVPEQYAQVLSKWASVSRTLNEAHDLLLDYAATLPASSDEQDRVHACMDELKDIEPALNALHALVRQELWKQGRKKPKK